MFLASFVFVYVCCSCWTEGAAGLPTNTSNADIRGCTSQNDRAPPRGFIRQDSLSLQSGSYPTASLEPLPALRFRFWFCCFPVPSEANPTLQPRLPSSITCIP